jgi:hypothetical protein
MKRSAAIERIYDLLNCDGVLEHSMPFEPVKLTEDHVRQIAKWIVEEVESIGMLPPPLKTDVVTSKIVYCYYPEDSMAEKGNSELDTKNSYLWDKE